MLHTSSHSQQPSRSRLLSFQLLLSQNLHLAKAAVLCSLLCLLLLGSWQAVRAQGGPPCGSPGAPPCGPSGSWGSPTTSNSGSWNYSYVYQGQPYNASSSWDTWYDQFKWVTSDNGSPSHVDSSGTYTETRVWSGTGAPPATVYILESSHVIGSGGIYGSVPGSGTAQDAFNDPPVPTTGGVISWGSKLIQMDSSSGTITLSGTISASGDSAVLPSGQPQGDDIANGSFGWNFDSRAVTISADVDVTNMKAPALNPDSSVQFDAYGNIIFHAVAHTPMLDGTMYGDVGLGYALVGGPDSALVCKINYTPHLAGTWGAATTYSWFSSLKGSGGGGPTFGNTYNVATENTDASPPLVDPGETGKVDHIHLAVTDSSDGAKGSADYYLALHQPDEFLPSNQAVEYVPKEIEEVEIGAPGYASPGLTVNCTWNAPGAYWDYLSGGADAMAEIPGADEAFPWFGVFCAAAGIAVDHLKPVPDTGGASFDPVQPGSTFPDEVNHPFATTPHTQFKMIPHILGLYKRTHLLQDIWNITGFVSETPINSDVYERSGGSYGEYRRDPNK